MLSRTNLGAPGSTQLLGECHPLLQQLGAADGLFALHSVAASLRLPKVDNPAALGQFLTAYEFKILFPLELTAICRAHHHASRNEVRELLVLDAEVGKQRKHRPFASASRRVGQSQLKRLEPLRDARIVQRYLQAVDQGEAQGWHTLVYGLTLAIYSLPVRQGLLSYARQTLAGFIQAAARPLRFSASECDAMREKLCAPLPHGVELVLQECALANKPMK